MRNILLLEPNYLNKYPPIGLMKIATYHRVLGDNVRFFKGDLNNLILDLLFEECLIHLKNIDEVYPWNQKEKIIKQFIKTRKLEAVNELKISDTPNYFLIFSCLEVYANNYKKKFLNKSIKFDRIYVTTLFTFYWNITIKTIEFAKKLVNKKEDVLVGGVLASLLHAELEQETGIKPMKGLLDKPGILDPDNSIIIDDLPLDYSILDEIDYDYPTRSAYFTFMTKGCTRKCSFCSVPILEPTYKPKIETIDKFLEIRDRFGEQQNLLLMDNNVLASPRFPEIIEEIKAMGFYKGATYIEPNQLEISIRNLEQNYNNRAFTKRAYLLIHSLLKRLKGKVAQEYYNYLDKYSLIRFETVTRDNLINIYPFIADTYEKYRTKTPKMRFVDFNQGTDARYVTDELMRLMSEIPIRPLRIAFDYLGMKKQYVNAVELAAKYGINELSNYILYNFKDTPWELYERLRINVELSENLNISIYSFPMKYIPLFGEEAKVRTFIGAKWNRKFIRAIQSVLNVTKGIVAPGRTFFEKAFGKTKDDFFDILYMPETYIVYRNLFEKLGMTQKWRELYKNLSPGDLILAQAIIESNNFQDINLLTDNIEILTVLQHYTVKREDVNNLADEEYIQLESKFNSLIQEDQFIDLTLTYDFESESTKIKPLSLIFQDDKL